jgi:predicted dehydrogenase
MREVENDDYAVALVEFESGARGVFEVARTLIGRHCDLGFEVHGSKGAASWSFQRMNELELYLPSVGGEDVGYRTVFAGSRHGDFGRFEPDTAIGMGYGQLKVSEAHSFLASIVDGRQRQPGMAEAERTARVIEAMIASSATGAWREVAAGA